MSDNRKYFKYGATIVVIVQGLTSSGGLFWNSVPKELSDINRLSVSEQWKALETARDTYGGIYFTSPSPDSAFRELLAPYINDDGYMCEEGMKIVHTGKHGDFCVRLVWLNKREDCLI